MGATYTHLVLFGLYDTLRAFRGDDEEMEAEEVYVTNPASRNLQVVDQVLAQNRQLEGVHMLVFRIIITNLKKTLVIASMFPMKNGVLWKKMIYLV